MLRRLNYLLVAMPLVTMDISTVATAGDTLAKIKETHTIVLANRDASVPFSYLDENKKPIGYSIDLCNSIIDGIRRELKMPQLTVTTLSVTPATRIATIVDGKADLECGSTTNNAERRKQVAFTIPHFIAAARMVVRKDSGIKNWSDLKDKVVVTTKGTTTVKLLNDRDKVRALALNLKEGKDHNDSFAMVERGEAQAFPMDDVLLFGLRANAKEPDAFVVVGDQLSAEPYAIMLRKDDPAFKALVDKQMARIINDGELTKLYDKWFLHPIPPKNINMHMPMGYLLRSTLRFPTDKVAD